MQCKTTCKSIRKPTFLALLESCCVYCISFATIYSAANVCLTPPPLNFSSYKLPQQQNPTFYTLNCESKSLDDAIFIIKKDICCCFIVCLFHPLSCFFTTRYLTCSLIGPLAWPLKGNRL